MECRFRDQGEVGDSIAEVLVEAGGEGAKHKLVEDLGADVAELIGEHLQMHALVIDGGVVLMTPKELLLRKTRR